MPHARHPVRSLIEVSLVKCLFFLLALLPRRLRLGTGRVLGLALYVFVPRLRRMAAANLNRAFADTLTREAKSRISRASFVHLGRLLCDTPAFSRVRPDRLEEFAEFEGLEHVRAAYAKRRGVFVFSGHYGNWEMVALIQGYLGLPLAMVTRPLDNPHLESALFAYRTLSGNQVIHKKVTARFRCPGRSGSELLQHGPLGRDRLVRSARTAGADRHQALCRVDGRVDQQCKPAD
jgi:KDO2-lipid IV(A) lauroyltransferase